jgi:hypothetical protein
VIALKVIFDLRAHIRQHGGKKAENGTRSN